MALYLILCGLIGPALFCLLKRSAPNQNAKNFLLTIPATLMIAGLAFFLLLALIGRAL